METSKSVCRFELASASTTSNGIFSQDHSWHACGAQDCIARLALQYIFDQHYLQNIANSCRKFKKKRFLLCIAGQADPEFGEFKATELMHLLMQSTSNLPCEVLSLQRFYLQN